MEEAEQNGVVAPPTNGASHKVEGRVGGTFYLRGGLLGVHLKSHIG